MFIFSAGISGRNWSGLNIYPPPGFRISNTRNVSTRTCSAVPVIKVCLSIPPLNLLKFLFIIPPYFVSVNPLMRKPLGADVVTLADHATADLISPSS